MESFLSNVVSQFKIGDRLINDHSASPGHLYHDPSPDGLCCPSPGHHDGVGHSARYGLDDHHNRHHKDLGHSQLMTLPIQKARAIFSSFSSPLYGVFSVLAGLMKSDRIAC